jgi:hypothetical protein
MTELKLNCECSGAVWQTMFSLCIPRVDEQTTEQDIMACFTRLSLGRINSVKVVRSFHGKKAFVNFARWYSTPNALLAKERLNSNKNLNVVYRRPWFWRVKMSCRGGD